MAEIINHNDPNYDAMTKEKEHVAKTSVYAAILLTSMKLVVGYTTGSLGIISEALHSGLDFVAALITFVAVRLSSKPPDEKYNYGRGKIESFSALIETLLLLATCIWIVDEAIHRIKGEGGAVEASVISFIIMIISICVDYTRSSALYRVAKKYNSQALMADALHFSSDILSSAVVIIGLIFVKSGYPMGDPIAALAVALLVIIASYRLGRETINCLMDKAPDGLSDNIEKAILSVKGVDNVNRLRVRLAGSDTFVDANINVSRSLNIEQAHNLAGEVERRVHEIVPNADVLIHLDPIDMSSDSMMKKVIATANKYPLIKETHNITFLKLDGDEQCVELHVTVDPELTLVDAHNCITDFEKDLLVTLQMIKSVNTHIDVMAPESLNCKDGTVSHKDIIEKISRIVEDTDEKKTKASDIRLRMVGKELCASVKCCTSRPNIKIGEAHDICDRIEHSIHSEIRNLRYVLVHIEPNLP